MDKFSDNSSEGSGGFPDGENPLHQKAARVSGKRAHSRGVATRERLLRTAERMFAQFGFEGVSVRDLAAEADVDLALINYHFKSKNKLFEAVLSARMDFINEHRKKRIQSLPDTYTLSDIVSCFLDPFHEKLNSDDTGYRYFADLTLQVASLDRYREFRQVHLDEVALMIVNAFAGLYPDADRRALFWAYNCLVSGLGQIITGSDRLAVLSNGTCDVRDLDTAFALWHTYSVAGINAVITGGIPNKK